MIIQYDALLERGIVLQKLACSSATLGNQKGCQREPKGTNIMPKGIQREPKGCQGEQERNQKGTQKEPKGTKRFPRGARREPKGSTKGAKGSPIGTKSKKAVWRSLFGNPKRIPFWYHFSQNTEEKIMPELIPKKT